MGIGDEEVGARYPCCYGPSMGRLCLAAFVIVALPVGHSIATDLIVWPVFALQLAALGGGVVFLFMVGLGEARRRRLICAAGRIMFLARSLPRRTDADTLAAVGEIRARYAEALVLAEGLGRDARQLVGSLRSRLERIDLEYDAQAGSLRCADASVARFAMGVRGFSEKVDVRQAC